MIKKVFISLFLLTFSFVLAQDEEVKHAKMKGYNPDYRINYFDKMIFQIDVNSDFENYYIPKLNLNQNEETVFVPKNVLKTKFSFDYKFLGLYLSVTPRFFDANKFDRKKGKTETVDFSFKFFYSDKMRQEITFRKIKGFYLEDLVTAQPLEIYSDLQISTYGGRTFYIINKNFSYRSFESMTERQIKSNGSLIPSVSYYFNNLRTNQEKKDEIYLSKINSFDTFFQIGYMHNFILKKKWFATFGAHPGIGLNKSSNFSVNPLNMEEIKTSSINLNYNLEVNAALGYNNKNFFVGIKSNYKNFDFNNNNSNEIKTERTSFGIYTGYRFNEIKSIKKVFNYIEKKLKI